MIVRWKRAEGRLRHRGREMRTGQDHWTRSYLFSCCVEGTKTMRYKILTRFLGDSLVPSPLTHPQPLDSLFVPGVWKLGM